MGLHFDKAYMNVLNISRDSGVPPFRSEWIIHLERMKLSRNHPEIFKRLHNTYLGR